MLTHIKIILYSNRYLRNHFMLHFYELECYFDGYFDFEILKIIDLLRELLSFPAIRNG